MQGEALCRSFVANTLAEYVDEGDYVRVFREW